MSLERRDYRDEGRWATGVWRGVVKGCEEAVLQGSRVVGRRGLERRGYIIPFELTGLLVDHIKMYWCLLELDN